MRHIIFSLIFGFSTAALAQSGQAQAPLELAPDAPDSHVVVRGDTLWGLSSRFLKDPYRWPEVWRMNDEQVKNPHRIYPGQVLILDRSGVQPRLRLGALVSSDVVKLSPEARASVDSLEIPAIPAQVIAPFLSEPLVIEPEGFAGAPRIVATQESRVHTGNDDRIYVANADVQTRSWQIYRPGKPLVDPDNGAVLGIEAIYLGDARTMSGPENDVTTMQVTSVKQEIGRGDRLVKATRPAVLSYMPHKPQQFVNSRVIALYNGVGEGGRDSIVSITRGSMDGIEPGHVLALYRAGGLVANRFEDGERITHKLPDERYGLVFVFRVFERVSYALVTDASRPVMPGDSVRQP